MIADSERKVAEISAQLQAVKAIPVDIFAPTTSEINK
jgi:hypothetical protein